MNMDLNIHGVLHLRVNGCTIKYELLWLNTSTAIYEHIAR